MVIEKKGSYWKKKRVEWYNLVLRLVDSPLLPA
jgi:hypothetical protein